MRRKRRLHKPEFKAKVALEAIKGEMTMAEMVRKYEIQAGHITQWKKQLLSGAGAAFEKGDTLDADHDQEVQQLRAKTGQLTMKNVFFEQGLVKTYGPRGKKW